MFNFYEIIVLYSTKTKENSQLIPNKVIIFK